MKTLLLIGLIILGGAALLVVLAGSNLFQAQYAESGSSIVAEIETPVGFQRAEGPRVWSFPEDFGPHPDYQTEWWYYTGNLESEGSERFGYQLTIFRRAVIPEIERAERESDLATKQIYMGHFAISDVNAGEHYAFERFMRGAAGLAGAQAEPYKIWLENWQIEEIAGGQYRLTAKQGEIALDLILEDLKGSILHGNGGYSQKGPEEGDASYYYSQTRLETSGSLQTPRGNFRVSGLSWKDHEFSTSALSAGQVGWDWFSIQLNDGSELMVFQIRRSDGGVDPFSSGTWIDPKGELIHLERNDFEIKVEDSWTSPHSGAEYPSQWTLKVPRLDLNLEVAPLLADQEMNVSYDYWEGAVEVEGTGRGASISGSGYVELTGYAASMEGEF
jgi:predicted secreted hydrolase